MAAELPTGVVTVTTIVRYVTFALALAMALGLLVYQYYVRFMINHGRTESLTYLVLPIYNMVLMIDIIASVVGIVITSDNTFTLYHTLLIPYVVYSMNPLVLIHMRQLPATVVEMLEVIAITTSLSVVAVIADVFIHSDDEFFVFSTICVVGMCILAYLPFRKRARSYGNLVANVHIALIEVWIAATVILNYFSIFDPNNPVLEYGPIARSAVWCASAVTSIWIMFKDTAYWRSLTEVTSTSSRHEASETPDDVVEAGRDSQSAMSVFRHAHAHVFIDFGLISIKQKIAVGGRSEVYLGTYKGDKVALKVYKPKQITDLMVRQWSHEIELTLSLQHPNIIKCYGVSIIAPKVAVVFEYCQRNLTDYIMRYEMNSLMAVALMLDIASGVAYLHSRSIIHRDIKADNVMVCPCKSVYVAKLIDFGESRQFEQTQSAMTVIGTPHYIAPEMLELIPDSSSVARAVYDQKVDIFSMAVVFWEIMHSGKNIFPTEWSIADIMHAVRNGFRPEVDNTVLDQFPEIVGLITQMWARDPHTRPSAKRVVAFLEEYQDSTIKEILRNERPFDSEEACAAMLMKRGHIKRHLEALKIAKFTMQRGLALSTILEEF
jgi:tRNA A-37 threonylcarbamoyl transferase component Bud32